MTDMPSPSTGSASTKDTRCASTCRRATPTLFVWAPYWFESEDAPWTCLRDGEPRVLTSTDECVTCVYWQSRGQPTDAGESQAPRPAMPDWFEAAPLPHEIE